ncbi:MAG TPA: amino acid permease [Armatimonadota bacterium]|nr:amino acid permease [Armatimonadota bacterium]
MGDCQGAGGSSQPGLRRDLSLFTLVAIAVCTVIGGGINLLTVEVQAKVPGIGSLVPLAFILGVAPALFSALCYAILGSAMPRAGGGYIYASRGLSPMLGFLAAFSKWFGMASAIGVLAYIDVPLLRDTARLWGFEGIAQFLSTSWGTLWIPVATIVLFWFTNLVGVKCLGTTVVVLMVAEFAGGLCLIATGLLNGPEAFAARMAQATPPVDVMALAGAATVTQGGLRELVTATSFLFFAYIGFCTISQAGGEAKDPSRTLPRAFVWATVVVTAYYLLFALALYHAVPWKYVWFQKSIAEAPLTAPGLLGILMPPILAGFVTLAAAITLANDVPPMLMAISRLFFSWAHDGVMPRGLARVNRRFRTPDVALTLCAAVACLVVVECHFRPGSGFFKGVDTTTISLLFTYLVASVTVLALPRTNPELYRDVAFIRSRRAQVAVALLSIATIGSLLAIQIRQDLSSLVRRVAIQQMAFPEDLEYHKSSHTWLRADGDDVVIGITPVAWLGEPRVSGVQLPEVGRRLAARQPVATLLSSARGSSARPVMTPVAGEVIAVNRDLTHNPGLCVTSPYDQGWLVRIRPEPSTEGPRAIPAAEYMASVGADVSTGRPAVSAALHAATRSAVVVWLVVLLVGAMVFRTMWARCRRAGIDPRAPFRALPDEGEETVE